jgi:zinc protease
MTTPSEDQRERPPSHGDVVVRNLGNGLGVWSHTTSSSTGGFGVGLHVAVGSLCESEEERGLSHLLEHLAFHGGRNFPPGALERFFDLHGTRLGRHHNANTGLEKTCFTLSFPEYAPETLDRAVACLADFAFGMEFDASMIDQERRVVLEEMRGHDGAGFRIRHRLLDLVLPGSLFAHPPPRGTREVIETATAHELGAYYGKWYRPDTCTVTAAGQVTEEEIAETVERHFGSWRAEGPPPPAPDLRVASAASGVRDSEVDDSRVCDIIVDPDTVEASAQIVKAHRQDPPCTREQHIAHSLQEAAIGLLGRRLGELAFADSGPLRNVRITNTQLARPWHLVGVAATTTAHESAEAAAALVRELHRITEHGFGEAEVESTAQVLRNFARRLPRREKRLPVRASLQELMDAVPSGEPPLSAESRSRILEISADRMDAAALWDQIVPLLAPSNSAVVVILPPGTEGHPSEEELCSAVRLAASAPTAAPVHHPRPHRLMEKPPLPGAVKERVVHDELGVHSLAFKNGVMVHIRPIEEETDRAIVQLRIAGGRIRETHDDLGLTAAAAVAFSSPAPRGVPSRVIRDHLVETTVALSCFVEEDCVTVLAISDPEDLEHSFQLLHLLLSRPSVEGAAFRRWQAGFEQYSADRPREIDMQMAQTSARLLTGDDHRFRILTHERTQAITLDAVQRWLDRELCTAPLELAVVGAIDLDRAAGYSLSYLGSLSSRPECDPRLAALRALAVPEGPVVEIMDTELSTSKAAVMVGWRAAPWHDRERRQPLHMAAHILGQRFHREIRQVSGLTYDVSCSYSPSRAYPEASLLAVALYTHPRRADEAAEAVRMLVESFAGDGPDEQEMESARLLFAELANRAQIEPRFWAKVLSELRYRGGKPSDLTNLPARCLRRTSEEVHQAVSESVRPHRRLTVVCRPPE